MKTLQFFFQNSMEAFRKGDYFPIWGTCQGFQALSIAAAHNESVLQINAFQSRSPTSLLFTDQAQQSKIFQYAPKDVIPILTNENITWQQHRDGIDPSLYLGANPKLSSFFRLIATNVDKKGKPYASMIESFNFPIYATQFHPERNQFEWSENEELIHSFNASITMQYLANYFVNETRKSNHIFVSPNEELRYLIYSFNPTYTGNSTDSVVSQQTYYFRK